MAVTCARCGTPNPDLNQFCQACGSPLAVAASPPAAPTMSPGSPPWAVTASVQAPSPPIPGPPPGVAPPGLPTGMPPAHPYQNPYYTPSEVGPQPTVHRTPWMLIGGVIVVLVLLMAGCGAGLALLGNKAASQANSGIQPSPLSSPSPAGSPNPSSSPNPSASPGASPTPIQTGGATASNAGETITLPTGWVVVNKTSESITITDSSGDGTITVGSGASSPPQTIQQNKDTVDRVFTNKYPDTKNCPNSQTSTGALNGAQGIFWQLCFTLASSGQSVPAGASLFAGANQSGSVYYLVMLYTSQDNMQAFIDLSKPILASIQWNLR